MTASAPTVAPKVSNEPPAEPTWVDHQVYVLDTTLELTSFVEMHQLTEDQVVFKNRKSKTYLTVNRNLAKILLAFRKPTKLKDLFPLLIEDRLCPRLDDLYELIMQARKAYLLLEPGQEEPANNIVNWRPVVRSEFAGMGSIVCILVGLGCWLFRAQTANSEIFQPTLTGAVVGYLIMCVAISIGYCLGASLANWHEREIYRPRFVIARIFPHFQLDLRDLQTAGLKVEAESALIQIAPMFIALGVVCMVYPAATLIVAVGTLLQMIPVKGSAIRVLLRSWFARKELSVHEHQDFVGNQSWARRVYSFQQNLSVTYVLAAVVYSLFWTGMVGVVLYVAYRITGATFLDAMFQGRDLKMMGITAAIASLIAGASVAGMVAFEAYFKARKRESTVRALPRRVTGPNEQDEALVQLAELIGSKSEDLELELLHATTLFRSTSLLGLHRFQGLLGFERFEKGEVIFEGDGLIDRALYICSGEVQIVKRFQTGRKVPVPNQGPNTIIDQISIMYGCDGHTEVRALTQVTCVSFMMEDFKKRIMPLLGWNHLERLLIRENYLKRLALTRELSQSTLDFLASNAKIVQYKQNETVIKEGGDNYHFYILLQGRFDVFKGRRRVGKLSFGEFFGELGLLLNSLPTASVVSIEGCVCLLIHKSAILQAMGQDYEFALKIEGEASKRLGRPVFPLKGNRFTNIGGLGR